MSQKTLEQKILQINDFDINDSTTSEYREWDNFMYRVHSVARKKKENKVMTIIGVTQSNRRIETLDAERVAVFANKNSITY